MGKAVIRLGTGEIWLINKDLAGDVMRLAVENGWPNRFTAEM